MGAWSSNTAANRCAAVIYRGFEIQRRKPIETPIFRGNISKPIINDVVCIDAQSFFTWPISSICFRNIVGHGLIKLILSARGYGFIGELSRPRLSDWFSIGKGFPLKSCREGNNTSCYDPCSGSSVQEYKMESVSFICPRGTSEGYERTLRANYLLPHQSSLFLSSKPDQRRDSEIAEQRDGAEYFNPKFYFFATLFLFSVGSFLVGFGWWYAHNGNGPVGWGLGFWALVGVGVAVSVVVFGLKCCQNAQ